MIRDTSPMAIGATAVIAFAIGIGSSFLFMQPAAPLEPLVRPTHAIEPSRPIPEIQTVSYASQSGAQQCNPWEVSDIAMEHILDEMLRRGWRAPTQGAAVSLTDFSFDSDVSAVDSNSLVYNARLSGRAAPEVVAATEAVDTEIEVALDVPAVEPPTTPAPATPTAETTPLPN